MFNRREALEAREIEAIILEHLLNQGRRCSIMDTCRYRAYIDGKTCKCAIGVLIKNEFYHPSLEGASMDNLFVKDGKWIPKVSFFNTELLAIALNESGVPATSAMYEVLNEWQQTHDALYNWAEGYQGPDTSAIRDDEIAKY